MPNPVIPSNIEAEVAILGCIFFDENLIISIADQVNPDDFYDVKNRLIFKTLLSMRNQGKNIDVTSLVSELTNSDLLASVGGYEYLSSLANFNYSTANIDTYIDIVNEASLKRQTINELNRLAQSGYDGNLKAFDYIENVEEVIFNLAKRRRVEDFRNISDVAKKVIDNTERNSKLSEEIIGLNTGFRSLNHLTLGFQPGQLLILAARPAMGKSAFAMNLAVNVATYNKQGKANVAIFSLEMSAEQLTERMLACDSLIKLNLIKSGHLSPTDWRKFGSSAAKMGEMNLYFDDSSSVKVADIRAKCRKLSVDKGLDFVVIDYLQLINTDDDGKSQNEEISKISRSLKLMARELNVPVLALSQLSRAVEKRDDKKPIMADLRDSGSIEQDADIVMFLYRDEYYSHKAEVKGEASLIISKNRSGATSEGLPFRFQGEYARFRERDDSEEDIKQD